MLGDTLKAALQQVGITPERVEQWLGRPCGCEERRQKLNALELWARRVVGGKLAGARAFFQRLFDGL